MLSRRALAPALSLVLTAGGVTLAAAPATAAPATATPAASAVRLSDAAVLGTRQVPLLGNLLEALVGPLLSGLGGVGETLTLTPPQWSLPGVTNSVQWLANGVPIPGATGLSFVPTLEQAGKNLQAKVTGSLLGLLPLETFTNVIPIPLPSGGGGGGEGGGTGGGGTGGGGTGENPLLEALSNPALTGIPGVGSLLQVLNPLWSLPGVSTTYQWFVDNVPVPGATGPTFVPGLEDAGKEVYARVTGTLAGVPVVNLLTSRLLVPLAPEQPLAASSAATLAGTAKVGKPLTVQDPTWNEDGVTHTYQWLRDGAPIAGATGKTYTLAPEDLGRQVVVKVTGSKEGWTDSTVDSNAVVPQVGDAPTFTTQPSVSGAYRLGQTLTANPGAWGTGSTPTFTYQWRRGGQPITGATSSTYAVTAADLGSTLSVTVTATRAAYAPATFTTSALPVAKLPSTTTITGKKKVRAGKPVRVVLGVLVDGLAPNGTVTVLDGTRTLKTVPIASGSRTLKVKGLKPGKHKLSAVYSGSDATEQSRSKVLKLRVLKRR
jgi:hypothetical protein